MFDGGSNVLFGEGWIFLLDVIYRISGIGKCLNGPHWYSRPSDYLLIACDVSMALNFSERTLVPSPHCAHSVFHLARHDLKRYLKNALTRHNIFSPVGVWIEKDNTPIENIKSDFRPKVIPEVTQFILYVPKVWKRHLGFIPKSVDYLEAYDVPKRINPAVRNAAILICETWLKKLGAVPVAELPKADTSQARGLVFREGGNHHI